MNRITPHLLLLLALAMAPLAHIHALHAEPVSTAMFEHHGADGTVNLADGGHIDHAGLIDDPLCADHTHGDCWLCWLALVPRQPAQVAVHTTAAFPPLSSLDDFHPPLERRPPKAA